MNYIVDNQELTDLYEMAKLFEAKSVVDFCVKKIICARLGCTLRLPSTPAAATSSSPSSTSSSDSSSEEENDFLSCSSSSDLSSSSSDKDFSSSSSSSSCSEESLSHWSDFAKFDMNFAPMILPRVPDYIKKILKPKKNGLESTNLEKSLPMVRLKNFLFQSFIRFLFYCYILLFKKSNMNELLNNFYTKFLCKIYTFLIFINFLRY